MGCCSIAGIDNTLYDNKRTRGLEVARRLRLWLWDGVATRLRLSRRRRRGCCRYRRGRSLSISGATLDKGVIWMMGSEEILEVASDLLRELLVLWSAERSV